MPLVIASGGNCGSQSATLMVRALAISDLELKDWFKAVSKETFVGLILGAAMAAIAAVVSKLYGGDYQIAIIVGLSMITIVFVANAFGALLPFILSRLKIDPAAASSPLITSDYGRARGSIFRSQRLFYLNFSRCQKLSKLSASIVQGLDSLGIQTPTNVQSSVFSG